MTSSDDANESGSQSPGGLTNLIALAHLAVWSEEERKGKATPSLSSDGGASSPSPDAGTKKEAPSRRKPAKKRAMPAPRDDGDAKTADHSAEAANEPQDASSPAAKPHKRPKSSKPKSKAKASKGSKSPSSSSSSFRMKANQPSFPVILMAILSAPQNREVVTFLSDGQSFIVVHPGALARNVLPMHFEDGAPTYDQFLYLLSIWGFETITDPQYPHVNVHRHAEFRKGGWEACLKMKLPDPKAEEGKRESHGAGEGRESPAAAAAANDGAELVPPTPATVRSVTPPLADPMTDLLCPGPKQGAQGSGAQLYSNLGPKFASPEKSLIYRRLLQQGEIPVCKGASRPRGMSLGHGTQRRTQLRQATSLGTGGHRRATVDCAVPPAFARPAAKAAPMGHRRATVEGAMSSVGARPSISPLGGNAMPMSRRRATLDMPPSRMANMPMNHRRATVDGMPGRMAGAARAMAAPSDAEVRAATKGVVSAALEALRTSPPVHAIPGGRRLTVDGVPAANTSRLDAMTDMFLKQSMARLRATMPQPQQALQSSGQPVTQARKVSMLGNWGL